MRQNGEKMSENNDTIKQSGRGIRKICYICRRPESKAGKMIAMPGKMSMCARTACKRHLIPSITAV